MNVRKSIILFSAALMPALLIDPQVALDFLVPIDESALSVNVIDVGIVHPQERVSGEFVLQNNSMRTVLLRTAQSDCGCMVVGQMPQRIGAGDDEKITFDLRTPGSAGPFTRQILVAARDVDVVWTCSVHGRVEADVWSDSPNLELPRQASGRPETTFAVYHRDTLSIKSIVPSDPRIRIIDQWPIDGGRMIRVGMRAPLVDDVPMGAVEVQVFTDAHVHQPHLSVPIHFISPPAFVCVPATLSLRREESLHQPDELTREAVALCLRSDLRPADLRVTSLVSWSRVEVTQVSARAIKLRIIVRPSMMPANFNGPMIRLTAERHNYSYDLSAIHDDSVERFSHNAR